MTEAHMRTTVILKDDLVKKAKKLSGEKTHESRRVAREFAQIDKEGWPSW
jgi:hypothetical protein